MEANDTGRMVQDGMRSSEEYGGLMETSDAHSNPLADHNDAQAYVHPPSNFSGQGSSLAESSETTLEIRIKTLDSTTYTVRVEKDISVPALKQQLASVVGVVAENQRLICRGRVLKDDRLLSSYNVEDGHTLHMVARHLTQPNSTSIDGQGFQGPLDGTATSQNQPAHVTHNVLVGTLNFPDVGEDGIPDWNRVSPDALTTMSLYMNRLEQALLASGYVGDEIARNLPTGQPQSSSQSASDERQDPTGTARIPTSRESLTPAALGVLVQRVHGLLRTQAGSILSNLASNLENESTLVDGAARVAVQSAAAWTGNILQQLGALFLELGRTTLTLHMGHTPANAFVNSGPALFISSLGPNPMMVQPPPLLPATLPLGAFSSGSVQPSVPGSAQPIGPGSPWPGSGSGPRSVNLHIHRGDLGSFLSSVSDGSPQNQQISTRPTSMDASRTPEQHLDAAIRGNNTDIGERSALQDNDPTSRGILAGNAGPVLHLTPPQGAVMVVEDGAVRMLPMRPSVSSSVFLRPTFNAGGRMVFQPLGVEFQLPSSHFHFSQSVRTPASGAFQQFQSNDSAPMAVNPRPVLPRSLMQLSRLSQALQPAVQSREQFRISTPASHRDEWLSQSGGWGYEVPLPSVLRQSLEMSFPSQQEDNINISNQTTISSEVPIAAQISISTAINVGEQPTVGDTDITVIVPEASRVESFSNTNQSTSVIDINMACEQDSMLSNAMESGQGDQSLEEEDKHEGKHCSKALDQNGQNRLQRPSNFNEHESCLAKRQKVDSEGASQATEREHVKISKNVPEIEESRLSK